MHTVATGSRVAVTVRIDVTVTIPESTYLAPDVQGPDGCPLDAITAAVDTWDGRYAAALAAQVAGMFTGGLPCDVTARWTRGER